ncbi:MAG: (Fe-S)-binding protein [Deltaproteobacteria bacterium]|mgnify:CR=1 FL=1|nr:(Fe-S)-binding protein [Deltaproteobacteria bacterium]MBW1929529.1 (Fe-S)-binding protein [Deltaproteobacteria bacterium]MBW2024055.1 (Fe-S)-binding protein [Deltaproteobacteria bacterium]MBW2124406.1 (Fe-S)-binding protein [Deltaproteobacteria bacterium]
MEWNIPTLKELEEKIWKCTACGNCKSAYDYGPPPEFGEICPPGVAFGFEGYLASKGKIAFARGILSGELEWDEELVDAIYKCTVCAGCANQCELDHKPYIPEIIEAMRRKAVEDSVGPMPSQKKIVQSMKSYDNPYQGPRRVRTDWTRPFKKAKKPIKDINKEPAPILYFVGCTGAFNLPVRGVPVATASIFQKLGLDFGILGQNEICCGSTAMRIGEADEFKRVAEANLKTFRKLHEEKGVNTIVTSCAGCYRAIKKDYTLSSDYDKMMEGITVIHTVEFLYNLYKEGKMNFSGGLPWKVTYHDPCHTGRHLNKYKFDVDGTIAWKDAYLETDQSECLYDIPRELLKAIPGIELIEMERIKDNSYCCGGGGGVMTGYGDWAAKNASLRIEEGMNTGAEYMISICPFCHYNLNEGSKRIGSSMKLYDLVELIDQVLPETEEA